MSRITHLEVTPVLETLLAHIQARLPDKLVGLYLSGSLVYGDFDPGISDLDLVAVTAAALDERELGALARMHQEFARANPRWQDRIEVIYVTLDALQSFRTQPSLIAVTSPGEPFHTLEAGREWVVNWYLLREQGVALFGPPPQKVVPPITTEEFVEVVRQHTRSWAQWVDSYRHRGGQAYARLTLCRALYTLAHGKQVSKAQAAAWAAERYPQWATMIQDALVWRSQSYQAESSRGAQDGAELEPELAFAETVRFVHFAIAQVGTRA